MGFRNHSRGLTALALVLLWTLQSAGVAQTLSSSVIKWDDYTFRFTPSGQAAQVLDSHGKVVGSILAMNGELQVIPLPGVDSDKLKQSFADWKVYNSRTHGGGSSGSSPGAAAEAGAACTAVQGAYYMSDSGWKPLTLVDMHRDRGMSLSGGLRDMAHNPFNARAGQTNIMTITNPSSHVTVGQHPKFCMAIPVAVSTDNVVIGSLDVKDGHREIESLVSARNSAGTWIPESRVHKVTVNRVSDNVVEITTQDALPPGQYVLAGSATAGVGTYDFGVQ